MVLKFLGICVALGLHSVKVIAFVILEVFSVLCNNNGARKNKMSCLVIFK